MELREIGQILRRRIWIPLVLTLVVALLSAIQVRPWQAPPSSYQATMRLLIGVLPAAEIDSTLYDPRYYAWQTSEYLVDDFTEVVGSELFAEQINQRPAMAGFEIPAGLIQGSAATGKQHRIITLSFTRSDEAEVSAIAEAATAELKENSAFYFRQLGTEGASITLLDGPNISVIGPSLRSRLDWPLRVLLALIAGIGIAFLLDYLDDSVRGRRDLEELGFVVVGEIPRHYRSTRLSR